ncbi:MAG TPA: hypothetical protein PLP88_04400 [Bacteroidales bacterium]|nr:hypothetical protein [Bacteroidales bacterium]
MPSKEIKELRQSGKLDEALAMAKAELVAQPDNIWAKRNISWVYYDYLKQNTSPESFDHFLSLLTAIRDLNLPAEEKMLFDHLSWQIGRIVFKIPISGTDQLGKIKQLLELTKAFSFTKPSEAYSFLFKAFHKALKETDSYPDFADWWDFSNFRTEDYQKEILPDSKEIMSIVEQGYITYAKHLLPKQIHAGELVFNKEKASAFLPKLTQLSEQYPQFQYPPYFQAKLLLALGDKEDVLSAILPFAKKKKNDFWVWEVLADAYPNDDEKVFAFYCKALSCYSPEEMLVSLRQKMAALFIRRQLFNEARTEIDMLVTARNTKGWRIPSEVIQWQSENWYTSAVASKSNKSLYSEYITIAEGFLFSDVPEEPVIVEFVNSDKNMLNFIASESKFGFFKYDRFFKDVKIGDVLKVRFQGENKEGLYHLYTAIKVDDSTFRDQFVRQVSGAVKISEGKAFGFLDDVYIHPSIVKRLNLADGIHIEGMAIKSYNQDKKQWGWKLI